MAEAMNEAQAEEEPTPSNVAVEETDDELWQEIQAEIKAEEQVAERIRLEMIANGTLESPNATASAYDPSGGEQLTKFQEDVITTGSTVSFLLLGILAILFIIQAFRKVYRRLKRSAALKRITSVLEEGVQQDATVFTPINPELDASIISIL